MRFLVDHNLEGYVVLLLGTLAALDWLDLVNISFVTFDQVELAIDSNDRVVWRFAQENQMLLLTGNRSMKGLDSLEQTLREENTPASFPVITVGNVGRLTEREYREQCSFRLVEIMIEIENLMGAGRIFIP